MNSLSYIPQIAPNYNQTKFDQNETLRYTKSLSRRMMWKNIMQLAQKEKKYNMILSTHSIEEAEILCDTVSWLQLGEFKVIGDPEQLKIQLSTGYNFHIKFNSIEEEDDDEGDKFEQIPNESNRV